MEREGHALGADRRLINVSEPTLRPYEHALVDQVLASNQLTQGPMVRRFEAEFAERLKVGHAVAVSSGTTALHLALAALKVGPGDEVLVPNLTFIATANAVAYTGAKPVLVDVDPYEWTIDLDAAKRRLTKRTKAVLPVHVYGVPCRMDEVAFFAERHGLYVVEDAAEGLGGSYAGKALGTFGDLGTFSFYGNKVLTTGEGGMVVTDDEMLAQRLRDLRGQAMDPTRRYQHLEVGYNYRLTELQAAIGVGQLAAWDHALRGRRRLFEFYRAQLTGSVGLPEIPELGEQAPWLFTVMVKNRNAVAARMRAIGVDTRPAFVPMSDQAPYYESRGFRHSRMLGRHGLSLPTHLNLTEHDAAYVVRALLENLG